MATTLITFPKPSPYQSFNISSLTPGDKQSLALLDLTAHEYLLLLALTRKGARRKALPSSRALLARHLIYMLAREQLRLTAAGWAVLKACRMLGVSAGKIESWSTSHSKDAELATFYPAG